MVMLDSWILRSTIWSSVGNVFVGNGVLWDLGGLEIVAHSLILV